MAEKKLTGKRTVATKAIKQVKIADINFDKSYQREVTRGHKHIVSEFMDEALGVPLLGEREDGTIWCVDGLQRIEALKKLGKDTVRADVFYSEGPEHEAKVFKEVNKHRTGLQPLQLFHALLTAQDKVAWAIKDACKKHKFEIPRFSARKNEVEPPESAKMLTCVVAMEKIYLRGGPDALEFVLSTLSRLWEVDPIRTRDTILSGLYLFWKSYKGDVDQDRLVERLNAVRPSAILYTADQMAGAKNGNAAEVIDKFYKKRNAPKKS